MQLFKNNRRINLPGEIEFIFFPRGIHINRSPKGFESRVTGPVRGLLNMNVVLVVSWTPDLASSFRAWNSNPCRSSILSPTGLNIEICAIKGNTEIYCISIVLLKFLFSAIQISYYCSLDDSQKANLRFKAGTIVHVGNGADMGIHGLGSSSTNKNNFYPKCWKHSGMSSKIQM